MNEKDKVVLTEACKLLRTAQRDTSAVWMTIDVIIMYAEGAECNNQQQDQLIDIRNELWKTREDLNAIIERISNMADHYKLNGGKNYE
ncbi:hypothetical protein [Sphingobacterium anhuiense]|uniref:hypothetical protein n=1 Tax=Sphingobacterium anhuiense TaxID=493780 RepID=UPI003C2ACD8C